MCFWLSLQVRESHNFGPRFLLTSRLAGILTGTSGVVIKLIVSQRRSNRPISASSSERSAPGVFVIGSLLLFVLFLAGTVVYCAKTLASLKDVFCSLLRIADEFGNMGPGCSNDTTGNPRDFRLSLTFGVIAQNCTWAKTECIHQESRSSCLSSICPGHCRPSDRVQDSS